MQLAAFILQATAAPHLSGGVLAAILAVYAVIILVAIVVVIIPFWFILKKAGFTPWLTLLNIVPLGALILLYLLAFAEWKTAPEPQQPAAPQLPRPKQTR